MGKQNLFTRGGGCEFCNKKDTTQNLQGVRTCEEHKDTMLILRCPVCNLDLAIHVGAFHGQRFWCVAHAGYHSDELRKDSRLDEKGNIKPYWSEENIKARRKKAEELNDKYYGKVAKDIEDNCNS